MKHNCIISIMTLFVLSIPVNGAEQRPKKRNRVRPSMSLYDRFIPIRGREEEKSFLLRQQPRERKDATELSDYQQAVQQFIPKGPILRYTDKFDKDSKQQHLKVACTTLERAKKRKRVFPVSPERILDAPDIRPDPRLTLMHWSQQKDILAVALYRSLYLWDASNGSITVLCELPVASITSVCWDPKAAEYIAIGTSNAQLQIWNISERHLRRTIQSLESKPVTTIAWCQMAPAFVAVGDGNKVAVHDVRKAQSLVTSFAHDSSVCQLDWSRVDGLILSGSQDGQLRLLSPFCDRGDRLLSQMLRAICALALNPHHKSIVAVASENTLSIFRVNTMTRCLTRLTLPHDIVSIVWSTTCSELAVAFGETIRLYRYGQDSHRLSVIRDIKAHKEDILSLALSADGQTLVSEAKDETLRFWKLFPVKVEKIRYGDCDSLLFRMGTLR